MLKTPRILLTAGEPAGIGPDCIVRLAALPSHCERVVVADPELLTKRAALLNIPLTLQPVNLDHTPTPSEAGILKILPVSLAAPVRVGKLNQENASYVIQTLEQASQVCLQGLAQAIVTAPVHKGVINDAGIAFTGHTEFLAHHAQVKRTVMLFVLDQLRVALLTTHLPLRAVPDAVTQNLLTEVVAILHSGLQQYFHLENPKIAVCGLNPHAGEDGHLGREEIEVIKPAITQLQIAGMAISGPYPADTIFTPRLLASADAILAMYHDQALPVIKSMGFDRAVNVTLGLPYIRTSVDHGTALDIAGTEAVDLGSMLAACKLAEQFLQPTA